MNAFADPCAPIDLTVLPFADRTDLPEDVRGWGAEPQVEWIESTLRRLCHPGVRSEVISELHRCVNAANHTASPSAVMMRAIRTALIHSGGYSEDQVRLAAWFGLVAARHPRDWSSLLLTVTSAALVHNGIKEADAQQIMQGGDPDELRPVCEKNFPTNSGRADEMLRALMFAARTITAEQFIKDEAQSRYVFGAWANTAAVTALVMGSRLDAATAVGVNAVLKATDSLKQAPSETSLRHVMDSAMRSALDHVLLRATAGLEDGATPARTIRRM